MNRKRGLGIWPLILVVIVVAVIFYGDLLLDTAGNYTYPEFLQDVENRQMPLKESRLFQIMKCRRALWRSHGKTEARPGVMSRMLTK